MFLLTDDGDTDQETDRLLGQQRSDDPGFYDEKVSTTCLVLGCLGPGGLEFGFISGRGERERFASMKRNSIVGISLFSRHRVF